MDERLGHSEWQQRHGRRASVSFLFLLPVSSKKSGRRVCAQSDAICLFEINDAREGDGTSNRHGDVGSGAPLREPTTPCCPQCKLPSSRMAAGNDIRRIQAPVKSDEVVDRGGNI